MSRDEWYTLWRHTRRSGDWTPVPVGPARYYLAGRDGVVTSDPPNARRIVALTLAVVGRCRRMPSHPVHRPRPVAAMRDALAHIHRTPLPPLPGA